MSGNSQRDKRDAILKFIKGIEGGRGKGRGTEPGVRTWLTPFLSTSNESVVEILHRAQYSADESYIDRLFDIPPPKKAAAGDGFFEDLHGSASKVEFRDRLWRLAKENHGKAGRAFVRKIVELRANDSDKLERFISARRKYYLERAVDVESPGRDPGRLNGKFATLYAAGCLAADFKIFPFSREEIRDALLVCQRDHVDFIADEMTKWFKSSRSRGGLIAANPVVVEAPFSYAKFKDRVFGEHREKLIDLTKNQAEKESADGDQRIGYIGLHNGEKEIWLRHSVFKEIAGGEAQAKKLKRKLAEMSLLVTEGEGEAQKYVVKRDIGRGDRIRVVALKMSPQPD